MKKMILAAALVAVGLTSCNKKADADATKNDTVAKPDTTHMHDDHANHQDPHGTVDGSTAQNALDWAGIYEGVLPCADCEGIKTEIALNDDDTFVVKQTYLGKKTTIEDKGKIMWHDGTIAHLKGNTIDIKLKVGENQLFFLNEEGNVIEGALKDKYILNKK